MTVRRGEKTVLDRIHLSIALGEHVAILGPNGSGKSSLIKAITRECYPQPLEGSWLKILGRDRWHVWDLRVLLGIVSNDLMQQCTRECSGREVVLSGFFSSVEIYPEQHHVTPEMHAKAGEVLELLEIPHLAGRNVSEMSSGEARRVLIGRALVHDPKALILDEPTNSLDLHAMHDFRRMMRKLAQSGISIILVTHHLSDLIPEIGRIVMLKDGRIYRDGPKEALLTAGALTHLFDTEVELLERDGYYQLW